MSSTLYNRAFDVELKHNFYVYTDAPLNNEFKVNRDMAIIPTRECEELMKRGRIRFVPTQKGFTTFYQAYVDGSNVQQPLVKLNDDSEFVFSMHMDVASIGLFLNVSALNVGSKVYGPGKFFMLNQKIETSTANPPQTLALTATLANSLRTSIFGYSFKPSQAWTGLADIIVKSESPTGTTVLTITGVPYNLITNTFSAEIDLSDQPKGFYVLTAYKTGSTNPLDELDSNDFYIDNDLVSKNTFGIIRLIYEDIDKLYLTTTGVTKFYTFSYTFGARSVKWRYYIIAENLDATFFTTWDLAVIKTGGPVFNASYHPPDGPFAQPYGQPDPTVPVNGARTVVLESVSAIALSEEARLGFDLYKRPVGGGADTRIISNLANASSLGVDSDNWGPAQTPIQTPVSGISEIYVVV